jgi:hypothetical protein
MLQVLPAAFFMENGEEYCTQLVSIKRKARVLKRIIAESTHFDQSGDTTIYFKNCNKAEPLLTQPCKIKFKLYYWV